MGCLKKTRNQCQPRGYHFDHDGCVQMYSNYIVKFLLNNRLKTDFKYFSSLSNYRLATYVNPVVMYGTYPNICTTSFRK